MSDTTTANGNTVRVHASALRNADETAARRLAARLPRNDRRVARVAPSPAYDALLWLAHPEGESYAFPCPDGYEIYSVFRCDGGGVCLRLNQVSE